METTLVQQIEALTAERDALANAVREASEARAAVEAKQAEIADKCAALEAAAATHAEELARVNALAASAETARVALAGELDAARAVLARPDFQAALQNGVKIRDLPADAGAVQNGATAEETERRYAKETDPISRAKLRRQIAQLRRDGAKG
jgi:chromosome segregation ATPase